MPRRPAGLLAGGQGVRSDPESEGFEEKYRAVIEWERSLMNRSAKDGVRSSPHYGGEGVTHSPIVPRCLLYSRKNLTLAWERVRANRGAGGADGVTIGDFETALDENLERLHRELRDETYQPHAVRRLEIPKRGSPGKTRALGIPSVYDRICQQALANRLEPIFEKVFDPSSFGYRKGRKTADALP